MSLAACGNISNSSNSGSAGNSTGSTGSNKSQSDDTEISDLQMVLLCDVVSRDELDTYLANGKELPVDEAHSPIRDDYLVNMYDRNLPSELSGFTVVDFVRVGSAGFRGAVFKKNNTIVVVYCGTEDLDIADYIADFESAVFHESSQDEYAKRFAEDNVKKYPACNIYVAGYSLGGRLAYLGTAALIDGGYKNRLIRVCTFNGLGVAEENDSMKDHITNHMVKGDDVSDGWIKDRFSLIHIGKEIYYDCTTPFDLGGGVLNLTKHDLYSFIDALSKHLAGSKEIPQLSFDITGSWKSVGDSGFGQAQPGTIVTFDGTHCNFYSPNDSYWIYQLGEDIFLECTNMLFSSDKLKFNVVIIDDNNIQIKYGSTITQLKRLNASSDDEPGTKSSDFSILGSWKSVGDSGFGQAQPGATVTFDGEHCNFYSPYDTYNFYQEDGKWKLSCKNVLWQDVLDFTVEIIDNDNINIYYGSSSVTKLSRIK